MPSPRPAPPLRVLLTVFFGVLCVAMTVSLSFGLMSFVQKRLADEQHESLATLAKSTSTMFAEGLYERLREIRLLAESPELGRTLTDPAQWRPVLARMQATRPQFAWIGMTDARGTVRVATQGLLEGQDASSRPWFAAARNGPYTGQLHPAKLLADKLPRDVDGGPIRLIDFAAPVRDARGRFYGVVIAVGSWDWARELIVTLRGQRNRDRGVLVYVLDAQGQVIHRPQGPEGAGDPPWQDGGVPAERLSRWSDGHDYVTASARVEARDEASHLGWTVVVRQPVKEAMLAANSAAKAALAIGLAFSLVGLGAAWWLAGRVSAPLAAVTRAASCIRDGDLGVTIPEDAHSRETQQLGESLRAMTEALIRQKAEVEEANRSLERRVAERTAELERASTELERLARHDSLTGLLNRRAGDERLQHDIALFRRHGTVFGLLLVDVDHFKQVNDRHGHAVGDSVLVEVARRLAVCCRGTDLVCRWGGEEFLVIVAQTGLDGALMAAEKIREEIAARPIGPLERVTVSIGVARPGRGTGEALALVKAADEALYVAKGSGRNRVHCGQGLDLRVVPGPTEPAAFAG